MTTLVAGLRMIGAIAPMGLEGPINGDRFKAYVSQLLIPDLEPGKSSSRTTYPAINAPAR